ncbi:MAG: tetratricopeptide repeat protein [Prosthecobacter sp.]
MRLPKAGWWVLLIITLITLGIYIPVLHHGVVLDDRQYLMENPLLKSSSSFLYPLNFIEFNASAQRAGLDSDIALNFIVRPVTYVTFYWNRLAGGVDPAGYRLVNILIHAVNGCLVFVLGWLLIQHGRKTASAGTLFAPAAAALLFTLHPLATESVTYVVQRFESLATMFYLSAAVLFIRGHSTSGLWSGRLMRWSVPVVVLAAMLSKEIGFTAPIMILLMDRLCLGTSWRQALQRSLPVLLLLPVIPILLVATSFAQTGDGSLWRVMNITNIGTIHFSPFEYALTQAGVCLRYLQLLAVPVNQNFDPGFEMISSIRDIRFILAFHGILALLLVGWLWHRRGQDQAGSLGFFGILWFFITLAPSSSVVPLPDLMAEHRSYLPSVGIFLAIAVLFNRWSEACANRPTRRHALHAAVAVWVIALGGATLARNEILRDDESIYRDVISKSPQRARAYNGLATALAQKGGDHSEEIISCLQKATDLSPNFSMAAENLAIILTKCRQYEKSLQVIEPLFLKGFRSARLHHCHGLNLLCLGRVPEAKEAFLMALDLCPQFRESNLCMGLIFAHSAKPQRALHYYQVAMATGPLPPEHQAIAASLPSQQPGYTDNSITDTADSLTRSILGATFR